MSTAPPASRRSRSDRTPASGGSCARSASGPASRSCSTRPSTSPGSRSWRRRPTRPSASERPRSTSSRSGRSSSRSVRWSRTSKRTPARDPGLAAAAMRVLFVTYCFGNATGHAQIGVYKRGLRVALELHERGHDVLFDCTGRTTYHDELTAQAEERIRFVDLRLDALHEAGFAPSRARAVQALRECRLDLFVVGEAPQVGTMLEGTLAAVE